MLAHRIVVLIGVVVECLDSVPSGGSDGLDIVIASHCLFMDPPLFARGIPRRFSSGRPPCRR